jgi:hypothetical protein
VAIDSPAAPPGGAWCGGSGGCTCAYAEDIKTTEVNAKALRADQNSDATS